MTASNAVLRSHRHSIRLGARVLIGALVVVGILLLIGLGVVRKDATSLFQSRALMELLSLSAGRIHKFGRCARAMDRDSAA